jgi:hypothetical protein
LYLTIKITFITLFHHSRQKNSKSHPKDRANIVNNQTQALLNQDMNANCAGSRAKVSLVGFKNPRQEDSYLKSATPEFNIRECLQYRAEIKTTLIENL